MKTFTVIGLGRFGTSVATQLFNMGYEVLAIDKNTVNDATAFLETFFKLYPTATEKELAYYVSGNVLVATQLFNMGYEVLAIDKNMDKINAIANFALTITDLAERLIFRSIDKTDIRKLVKTTSGGMKDKIYYTYEKLGLCTANG